MTFVTHVLHGRNGEEHERVFRMAIDFVARLIKTDEGTFDTGYRLVYQSMCSHGGNHVERLLEEVVAVFEQHCQEVLMRSCVNTDSRIMESIRKTDSVCMYANKILLYRGRMTVRHTLLGILHDILRLRHRLLGRLTAVARIAGEPGEAFMNVAQLVDGVLCRAGPLHSSART